VLSFSAQEQSEKRRERWREEVEVEGEMRNEVEVDSGRVRFAPRLFFRTGRAPRPAG